MPLVDETAPHGVIDSIPNLAGMLQGAGISLTTGEPGEGGDNEDIVVRIKPTRRCCGPMNRCRRVLCF